MGTRTIVVGIVVVLVVLVGAYLIYASTNQDQSSQTSDGGAATDQVQAQEVAIGTGTEAKPGDTVSVLYVGQLQDGTVFDSSSAHNNEPLTFVLGAEGVIPGFQIGINGMRVGGERLLAIPPSLGYGAQEIKDANGAVIIPANSTIVFDVKLIAVVPAGEVAGESTTAVQ